MKISRKSILSLSFSLIICLLFLSSCKSDVSLASLVKELSDRNNITYFPENPYSHLQSSSYNPASVSPEKDGWFENFDMSHFIRVENNSGRREFVMLDNDGPGAIVRWWMTFYKAQNGIIRIYIDKDTIPVIEGSPDELLSGSLLTKSPLAVSVQEGAEIGEEGRDYDHNFYVPIPFTQHCKITYECDSLKLLYDYEGTPVKNGYYWPDVFYNIGIRSYQKQVRLKSATRESLMEARKIFDEAGEKLFSEQVSSSKEERFETSLVPGDSLVLEYKMSKHALNRLKIILDAKSPQQALRSVVLKATFDGLSTIWTPVGEFFGTGYSLKPHKTFMNKRLEDGTMESFWIMPFRETCRIVFINYGSEIIKITGLAGFSPYTWKNNSMYFAATWHEYHHIRTRTDNGSMYDLNYVDISGKGVYVGDQVNLFNNTYFWWGEGDEKIFVDGEAFPSSFGTGSEDYYGYSFARPEAFSHPFLSQPEGTGNTSSGITVNMRHRILDAIPFTTSISSNIELWHWADIRMNYALTSYFYVLPPFKVGIIPDVEAVKRNIAKGKEDFIE